MDTTKKASVPQERGKMMIVMVEVTTNGEGQEMINRVVHNFGEAGNYQTYKNIFPEGVTAIEDVAKIFSLMVKTGKSVGIIGEDGKMISTDQLGIATINSSIDIGMSFIKGYNPDAATMRQRYANTDIKMVQQAAIEGVRKAINLAISAFSANNGGAKGIQLKRPNVQELMGNGEELATMFTRYKALYDNLKQQGLITD